VADWARDVIAAHDTPSGLQVRYDRIVNDGCSLRRPDILIDCLTHAIIIEADEFQHGSLEYCSCENKRVMQLFQDLGNRPLLILRFNPDAYLNLAGNKVQSCFKQHKRFDVPQIADKDEWASRLKVLKGRLYSHAEYVPEQELTVEHLYYNGFC